MSVLFSDEKNILLCHSTYINRVYDNIYTASGTGDRCSANIKDCIFDINIPFSKLTDNHLRHRKAKKKKQAAIVTASDENQQLQATINYLSQESEKFLALGRAEGRFEPTSDELTNHHAQAFIDIFRTEATYSRPIGRLSGENTLPHSIIMTSTTNDNQYLIPSKCKFYNRDIRNLDGIDLASQQYDLIVIDPPWWNKYIRRSRGVRRDYR